MKVFISLLALLLSGPALAAKPYNVESIMLLQPEVVLKERVAVTDLGNYINEVNAAAEKALSDVAGAKPAAGFIAVAVRPGGQSKVWLDLTPALEPAIAERLRASMQQVAPFEANGGVVVFAINATLWGAAPTDRDGPAPAEWQAFMQSADGPMEVGEMVTRMWASEASEFFPELAQRVLAGDADAFREVLAKADVTSPGHQTEELALISSWFVRLAPDAFLRAQAGRSDCFGVAFMGPDFVDDPEGEAREQEARRKALESVSDPRLSSTKRLCLAVLEGD